MISYGQVGGRSHRNRQAVPDPPEKHDKGIVLELKSKQCPVCGKLLKADMFGEDRLMSDGLSRVCRKCSKGIVSMPDTEGMGIREAFGERIGFAIRTRFGSANDFSKEVGSCPQTVRRWMKGESLPTYSRLMTICESLQVSPRFLIGMEGRDFDDPPQIPERFGGRVKLALKSRGMTARHAAALFDANPASVSKWINGFWEPKTDAIFKICDALNVSPEWLMRTTG